MSDANSADAQARTHISDEQFRQLRATARPYTAVILHPGPNRHAAGADAIIYEHGMRNVGLYLDGTLPVVCPSADVSDFSGLSVFDGTPDEVTAIMDADPAVQAGVLTYELHPVRSFPGSTLPG
jgi:hypothetical protein